MSEKHESLDAEMEEILDEAANAGLMNEYARVFANLKSLILKREELAWDAARAGEWGDPWGDPFINKHDTINDWREQEKK